jgi:hypothetical protein
LPLYFVFDPGDGRVDCLHPTRAWPRALALHRTLTAAETAARRLRVGEMAEAVRRGRHVQSARRWTVGTIADWKDLPRVEGVEHAAIVDGEHSDLFATAGLVNTIA